MRDHRSYGHNLGNCKNEGWKKIQAFNLLCYIFGIHNSSYAASMNCHLVYHKLSNKPLAAYV